MKALTILISLIVISLIQTKPFDQFLKKIPDGWSSHTNVNRLVISRDSTVKIQYFNYGMEANPPILEHKFEIVIEYEKRLSDRKIQKRKNRKDSLMNACEKRFDLSPSRKNRAKYEVIDNKLNTKERFRIPFYSDDKYSYFMQDNFPYGYMYLNDSDRIEIEDLISKLKKME